MSDENWYFGLFVVMTVAAMSFAVAGFELDNKLSEVRSERSELKTKVQTLVDSINHPKGRSDTLTVIIEAASKYDVSPDLTAMVIRNAKQQNVDPKVALSLVQQESSFRTNVLSGVGAVGIAQVMPNTAHIYEPGVSVAELYEPETNIRIAMKYLSDLLERYGSYEDALAAYNVGPTDWDRGVNQKAGRRYATDVLSR